MPGDVSFILTIQSPAGFAQKAEFSFPEGGYSFFGSNGVCRD